MSRKFPSRAKRHRPFRSPARITLSDEWRAWIVENAAKGASAEELVQTLHAAGIARTLALREVDAVLRSPAWPGSKRLFASVERVELALRLHRTLAAYAPHPGEIERRATMGADELYDHYASALRPVVLTEMLKSWPAFGKWSPEYFAEHFGEVPIEVVADRDADPDCNRNLDAHRRTMTMAAYCALVRSRSETDDFYLVSNNRALERPELSALLSDLHPPADLFDVPVRAGSASLWFGPGGTFTPLHHDLSNILICQLYGRKRFRLVAPFSAALLQSVDGYYAPDDWEERLASEEAPLPIQTVALCAGEALFLPAGYWHEVEALEPSIHVSMLGFRRPGSVTFYKPGFVGKR